MSVIWLVEKNIQANDSLHSKIAGNFAVRIISSVDSLRKLIRIEKDSTPDLILIDSDHYELNIQNLKNTINYSYPNTRIAFSTSNSISKTTTNQSSMIYKQKSHSDMVRSIKSIIEKKFEDDKFSKESMRYRDISYDRKRMTLKFLPDGVQEKLPLKEAMILDFFLENPSVCISREDIQRSVWFDTKVASRTIDSHISRLRKKIQNREVSIDSVYGGGYILK